MIADSAHGAQSAAIAGSAREVVASARMTNAPDATPMTWGTSPSGTGASPARSRWAPGRGPLLALAAAALFGASTPAAKPLLGVIDPFVLAGLLDLGSGLGLGSWWLLARARRRADESSEAPLGRRDVPWLAAAIASGGVAAPLLLMWGLAATPASTASLLLNLEGVLTAVLAWFVFHEGFDRRIALGMLAIAGGSMLLVGGGLAPGSSLWGPLAIVGACLGWALDNNLTRRVSGGDPVAIAALKGIVAGPVSLALGRGGGAAWPASRPLLLGAAIGVVAYGVSLVLYVRALRDLGAARTGAYFSSAPFVGAALSLAILGEPLSGSLAGAGLLMGLGLYLHLTEHHAHEHTHEPLEHEHRHVHDEHHQHPHDGPAEEPHSHPHRHDPATHSHPHFPDLHHRHRH